MTVTEQQGEPNQLVFSSFFLKTASWAPNPRFDRKIEKKNTEGALLYLPILGELSLVNVDPLTRNETVEERRLQRFQISLRQAMALSPANRSSLTAMVGG